MYSNQKQVRKKSSAFTIVELLIVIVVIAILATIVTVAYNGITKKAVTSSIKSSLQTLATKMKTENATTETYPTVLPSITPPTGVGFALVEVSSNREFCINGTSETNTSIEWHIDQTGTLASGLCSGPVIVASIIGDYNETSVVPPAAEVANGDGGGLVATASTDWQSITVSWNPVANASRYEVQLNPNGAGTWYLRRIAASPSNGNAPLGGSYEADPLFSAHIPNTSTSITWAGAYVVPQAAGQQFQYRYRSYDSGGVAGLWYTAILTAPTTASVATITNLTGSIAANWGSVDLNWTTPAAASATPGARLELQLRNTSDGVWYLRRIADSSSNANAPVNATYETDPAFSARIPLTTQTMNWKGVNPMPTAAGQVFEYRIRIVSSVITGLYGPWSSSLQLSAPSNSTYGPLTTLNGVASGTGSSSTITLTWSPPSPLMPGAEYEVQLRNVADGVWYLRRLADSSSSPNAPLGSSYDTDPAFSAKIPSSSTSLVWDGVNAVPQTGQTFEYKIRQKSTYVTGLVSDWQTIQVSR